MNEQIRNDRIGTLAVIVASAVFAGAWLLAKTRALALVPDRRHAMASFHASLVQLTVVLVAAIVDVSLHAH